MRSIMPMREEYHSRAKTPRIVSFNLYHFAFTISPVWHVGMYACPNVPKEPYMSVPRRDPPFSLRVRARAWAACPG